MPGALYGYTSTEDDSDNEFHRIYKVEIYREGPFNHDFFLQPGRQVDFNFLAGGDNAMNEPPYPTSKLHQFPSLPAS